MVTPDLDEYTRGLLKKLKSELPTQDTEGIEIKEQELQENFVLDEYK